MDLTKAYMKSQGTLGELSDIRYFNQEQVIIAYSEEGCEAEHYYTSDSEAKTIVNHWGETGELKREFMNIRTGEVEKHISYPDYVHIFRIEKSFERSI